MPSVVAQCPFSSIPIPVINHSLIPAYPSLLNFLSFKFSNLVFLPSYLRTLSYSSIITGLKSFHGMHKLSPLSHTPCLHYLILLFSSNTEFAIPWTSPSISLTQAIQVALAHPKVYAWIIILIFKCSADADFSSVKLYLMPSHNPPGYPRYSLHTLCLIICPNMPGLTLCIHVCIKILCLAEKSLKRISMACLLLYHRYLQKAQIVLK